VTSQLERAVEVMDRLRSPGGCPWDAEQTHESLTRYLLEETYEVLEAIETGDLALLREELGDLLLQVLFHARITQELPAGEAFGIEDVARDLAVKLIRRHPHVYGGADSGDAGQLIETWE
jgi:XTP/dITP diphosphohydrolase